MSALGNDGATITPYSPAGKLQDKARRHTASDTTPEELIDYLLYENRNLPETEQVERGQLVSIANKLIAERDARMARAAPDGVGGLFDRVYDFLGRFIAYPSEHTQVAHLLWIVHTHLMDLWESTPRIAFLSPEPASGKTRALEISETLVPRPVEAINATPAYLFRKVSDPDGPPTILFDEIDTVFGPRAKENEEIRGILNAGHRRGAMAGRCVVRGKIIETEELPAYCAVALAGLGNLPDTILTRSVVVPMRRRAPTERVEPYRRRLHSPEGNRLRDELAAWAAQTDLEGVYPDMPVGVEDRAADVWEPLLSVADAVGGDWPERARVAAVALVALARVATPSLGIHLLADLRDVFGVKNVMTTKQILLELCSKPESPWETLKGGPLDARKLSNYLRQYDVKSKTVRVGDTTPKGYAREDLWDSWIRYLGDPAKGSATSATTATNTDEPWTEAEIEEARREREAIQQEAGT